jgi:formylglycine-generating enzyme required for sulfatase activity
LNNLPSILQSAPENTQTQEIATLPQNTIEPSATKSPELTSTLSATQTPTSLPTEIKDAEGVSMVLVPAGEFIMGSDEGSDLEKPSHKVYLNNYYIDIYEVDNESFTKFLNEFKSFSTSIDSSGIWLSHEGKLLTEVFCKTCASGIRMLSLSYEPNGPKFETDTNYEHYPVTRVTWYGASAYCEWRGARLPTEAEWEKAARGTDGRIYPWGDEIDCNYANYNSCVGGVTLVGNFENGKSIFGVYDMVGNVKEWGNSLFMPYPYSAVDGREELDTNNNRIVRGSGWGDFHAYYNDFRTYHRVSRNPEELDNSTGFRCAKDAGP